MTKVQANEVRTWKVGGMGNEVITVEWNRQDWNPPKSVVKVNGEVVSKTTFWSRQFCFGVHAFLLKGESEREVVIKYSDKDGFVCFVDGQRLAFQEETLTMASAG